MQFYKSAIHKLEGYLQTDLSANEYGHSELETGCPPSDDHAVESGFCRYLQLFSWSLQLLAICLLVNQCGHQSNTVFGEFLLLLFSPLFLDARRLPS